MVIKGHIYYGQRKNKLVAVSFELSKYNVQYYIVSMQIIKNLREQDVYKVYCVCL